MAETYPFSIVNWVDLRDLLQVIPEVTPWLVSRKGILIQAVVLGF